ncbi:hypothetical protein CKM354_000215300 [Cercospora kikuchii]|uniref:Uncharacterized protein n=1 Tax=Cercospora kikuchii TaxID=84275 RepID=A0A9P3C9A5_9PEZI|nr:uncharacterized protein CKM354_000215300 [Cercospora kikuchii]GIZ38749.1 hypothetical protein CKM354_000215300 [Cercospora kikuchii]
MPKLWLQHSDLGLYLDAIGLLALADLEVVARQTALAGNSSLLDALLIAPGLHRQQHATELNKGEYPACAAMTTGYVFRIENQATVAYLQRVGKPGHLTTLEVTSSGSEERAQLRFDSSTTTAMPLVSLLHWSAAGATIAVLSAFVVCGDVWAIAVLSGFICARICNIAVVRRRCRPGWFGAPEPGVRSDLLILLSQDKWIRMRGSTDDIKAVTSGTWMQDATALEDLLNSTATVLTYLDAGLVIHMKPASKVLLLGLLLSTAGLLGLANNFSAELQMHGRLVSIKNGPKAYPRRRVLADELVEETGKKHWAMKLGLLPAEKDDHEPPTI